MNDYEFYKRLENAKKRLGVLTTPEIKYCGVPLEEFTQTELIKIIGLTQKSAEQLGNVTPKSDMAEMHKLFNKMMAKYQTHEQDPYALPEPDPPKFEVGNAVTVKNNMGHYSNLSGVIVKIEFKNVAWVKFPNIDGEVSVHFNLLDHFDYSKAGKK